MLYFQIGDKATNTFDTFHNTIYRSIDNADVFIAGADTTKKGNSYNLSVFNKIFEKKLDLIYILSNNKYTDIADSSHKVQW